MIRHIEFNENGADITLVHTDSFRMNGRPSRRWEARAWTDDTQTCTKTIGCAILPKRFTRKQVVDAFKERGII